MDCQGNGTGDETPHSDDGQTDEQSTGKDEIVSKDNKSLLDEEGRDEDTDASKEGKQEEPVDISDVELTPDNQNGESLHGITLQENTNTIEKSDKSKTSEIEDISDAEKEKESVVDGTLETPAVFKGNVLARYILTEESLARVGSVDVDDNAHLELENLNATPKGKSWDDELKETAQHEDNKLDAFDASDVDKLLHSQLNGNQNETHTAEDTSNSKIEGEKIEETFTELITEKHETINAEENFVNNVDDGRQTENVDEIELIGHNKGTDNLTMPETREETDGCVSPSLMFASCRYRWEKTIVTQAPSVVFVTLNKKEIDPIKLEWSESEKCFYSDEVRIPVGSYIGNIVIDGVFYPAEDIIVKHYTFEVDLYLKDDIIEDEAERTSVAKTERPVPVSKVEITGVAKAEEFLKHKQQQNGCDPGPYRDIGTSYTPSRATSYKYSATRARMEVEPSSSANHIESEGSIHLTSKYEELVRSQMSQTKSAIVDNNDSDEEVDGRRSPVGDDGVKQYQDGDETALKALDMGHVYKSNEDLSIRKETFNDSLVEDDVERWSVQSNQSMSNTNNLSDRQTPQAVIDDVLGNGRNRTPIYSTESPVHSKHSSAHSSARQTPTVADLHEPIRSESVNSVNSANSVSRHVLSDLVNDVLGRNGSSPNLESKEGSRSGSVRQTPTPEQISDVLNPADRHSPIRREYLTGSPYMANLSGRNSAQSSANGSQCQSPQNGSQRQTPQKELISGSLRASQEKLYSPHDIRTNGGVLYGSHNGSSASSRPQSLTSEQELTQYYENVTEPRRTPVIGDSIGQKTGGTSSLPVLGSQRYGAEKRSMTPDNHIRVPETGLTGSIVKGPLLPSRTTPRTPLSNASSRTVTPVNAADAQEMRQKEQIKDLENTTSNLRQLLALREQEVVELKGQFEEIKEISHKLQGDLDRHRARASPGPQIAEIERKYREALDEHEKMNAEVHRLTEELKRKNEPGLNSYNPNSPTALQRKNDELTSQIQDLQEANESAHSEISAAENKVKELAGDNETLRVTHSARVRSIEDENRHLKSEVQRLKESHSTHSDATDYRLKIELQQVKDDNRSIRARNYQLHDDNIRVKEELSDLRKSLEMVDSTRKPLREERTISKTLDTYDRTAEKEKTLDSSYHSDHGSHDYRLPDTERATDVEKHKYSYKRSTYDTKSRYKTHTDAVRYDTLTDDVRYDRRTDGVGYDTLKDVGGEKEYDTDRFIKSDLSRYDSYRSVPDGGSSEKPARTSTQYDPRPLTPERPSALGPPKKDYSGSSPIPERQKFDSFERRDLDRVHRGDLDRGHRSDLDRGRIGDLERGRRERSRTSSADFEYKSSLPLSTYNADLSKTAPALSGRSRDDGKRFSAARTADLYARTTSPVTQSSRNTPPMTQPSKNTPPMSFPRDRDDKGYDPQSMTGYQDDGEMSDTATDILVNAQLLDKLPSSSWNKGHNRRGSGGSDASNSSFSDIDEQLAASARKRSKSADGREILRRMVPTGSTARSGSAKGDRPLSRTLSPVPPSGLRTVTPRPLATQHNKATMSLSSSGSLTQGLQPFAPRSAADLQINDVVKFSRQGGKLSQGTIKFIGHFPGHGDIYLGIELDKEDGRHDGVFENVRYFKCKPNKGVFVAYNKVVMAWTSY